MPVMRACVTLHKNKHKGGRKGTPFPYYNSQNEFCDVYVASHSLLGRKIPVPASSGCAGDLAVAGILCSPAEPRNVTCCGNGVLAGVSKAKTVVGPERRDAEPGRRDTETMRQTMGLQARDTLLNAAPGAERAFEGEGA